MPHWCILGGANASFNLFTSFNTGECELNKTSVYGTHRLNNGVVPMVQFIYCFKHNCYARTVVKTSVNNTRECGVNITSVYGTHRLNNGAMLVVNFIYGFKHNCYARNLAKTSANNTRECGVRLHSVVLIDWTTVLVYALALFMTSSIIVMPEL